MSLVANKVGLYTKIYTVVMFCVITLIGFLSIYFSWLSSPKIGTSVVIPSWIASWVDKNENDTIRTAVPFVIMGVLLGLHLMIKKKGIRTWVLSFLILIFLVICVEMGQLFLPLRIFDWKDIYWGIMGSLIGLLTPYIVFKLIKKPVNSKID